MKLCVALDLATKEECLRLAKELKGLDLWLKVGLRAYLRDGFKFIEELKKNDEYKIFLDLKIHDIPNTMADACEEISKLGVDMINIHASAGKAAMQEVMSRLNRFNKRPLVLAVSALTSFDEENFYSIYKQNIDEAVIHFSKMSYQNGLDGMVCSVFESKKIKEHTNSNFLTLTPGIRPFGEASDDQKRVANLTMARENLSDYIVVGRPIYKNENPRAVCEKILDKIHRKNISENDIEQNYEAMQQKEWDMCNHFEEWIKTQPDKEQALKEFYTKCGIKY
ncbi:orotidine-5'-phosphate decarboxylase [Campylobacter coli]|uniref:Orotidine 5'-phosphate decarboxylase n=2 Tax=Campylobacter TaxID=194 RepID=A0A5Y9DQ16_CAMCO|nr:MULTISPECIES: orotidine-5'-phosphate decarboxylase [Campylobacter]EAH6488917.1 orotidine-5'-phosphate decarboxylase [Campylobacter coli]EAH7246362.1 orotidine-5'-phosphate decarboxylase [Campylobacter coli]EAH8158502.1 orotidine-5'-phosphate decarboxylase [Campylobacter coli]EAI0099042.1 orotidine-5'-phosphate decarboxylase [Campylobacter coli]EAI0102507.1 orotidine-5'-phosphate decarboxylase [Campylobacter coli]